MSLNSTDVLVWKPVAFTHVEYPKGDFIGFILAWSSLFPFFVLSGFVTHIYFRREIHTITFFTGIFLNEGINQVLKYAVGEPRPSNHHAIVNVQYGWPSSHSQFTWFFCIYIIFFVHIRSHSNNSTLDLLWKYSMTVLCITTGCIVSFSRYYLEYHTINQIVWGCIIGITFAVAWFSVTHIFLSPLFPIVVCWPICELLMIRDSSLIPNIMWFEYATSRQESRARSRKLTSSKTQ